LYCFPFHSTTLIYALTFYRVFFHTTLSMPSLVLLFLHPSRLCPYLDRRQILVRSTGRAFGAQLDAALAAVGATGVDVVLDSLLGDFWTPTLARAAKDARIVVFGAATVGRVSLKATSFCFYFSSVCAHFTISMTTRCD
jgi:hypothetical protein